MVPYIHTNDALTVVIKGRPHSISKDSNVYEEAAGMLAHGTESDFEELLTRVQRKLAALDLQSGMQYSDGVITYNGEVLHNYAADRLIAMIDAGHDYMPLARFLAKLQQNPSKRVVDNLYAFLEHGNIPLTVDGDFLTYKAVRENYYDIHSGTFYNGIGALCSMPRNKVDEDQNRTCSAGLHVCSFDYLQHFASANGHVMVCKVNPAHVVAIPADYDNTKMRVSEYRVVDEVLDYYSNTGNDVLGDVGATRGVWPGFAVFDASGDEWAQTHTLEEAKIEAHLAFEHAGGTATVQDSEGMVVYEYTED